MKTIFIAVVVALVICTGFVFAGEKARDGRFIAFNNGTVLDTKTNLMWSAKDNGKDINWGKAKSYCEDYRGGGYTDWRMPTKDELASLYDEGKAYKCSDCGNNVHLTELIQLTCGFVWASDSDDFSATGFHFAENMEARPPKGLGDSSRVIPVRSSK